MKLSTSNTPTISLSINNNNNNTYIHTRRLCNERMNEASAFLVFANQVLIMSDKNALTVAAPRSCLIVAFEPTNYNRRLHNKNESILITIANTSTRRASHYFATLPGMQAPN